MSRSQGGRWHQGELFPRVGFVITNLSYPTKGIVSFYNGSGTVEQWIKEGKYALIWDTAVLAPVRGLPGSAVAFHRGLQLAQLLRMTCFARSDKALVPDKYSDETHQDRRKAGAPCQEACVPACRGDSNELSVR